MITPSEKLLMFQINYILGALTIKIRIETEMHPTEKCKIYTAMEALLELEDYYTAKKKKGDLES